MPSFLAPWFLAGAAAAAVPLVLHLLRRHPEQRVRFAAVRLLKEAPVEHAAHRRLRELLLLALRVAAIVLLAVAFARPFFRSAGAAAATGTTVVALDTSYSMSSRGTLAAGRRLAREAITNAAASDRVAVVTFADTADAVVPPTTDRAAALAAIERTAPGYGATRYRAGLLAASRLVGRGPGKIVIVTDLQETGWDAGEQSLLPESTAVAIADVGVPPANVAVTSVRQSGPDIVATIRSTAAKPRDVHVRLTIDNGAAVEKAVSLPSNDSVDVTFASARGKEAAVEVDDRDGFQADNVRFVVLDQPTRGSIAIVTANGDLDRDAFFVRHALAAGGNARIVVGLSTSAVAAQSASELATHPAIVLLATRGLERHAREGLAQYVKQGGGLVLAASADIDAQVVADVLGPGVMLQLTAPAELPQGSTASRTLAATDLRHPLFRALGEGASLGLVKFPTIARLAGAGCQTLARFSTGETGVMECTAGDGRALVFGSDLNNRWNDFPQHATFVPFLQEAVRYVGRGSGAGEFLIASVPGDVPKKPGFAAVKGADGTTRRVAVNVDPRESDGTRLSADEFMSAVTHLKTAGAIEARLDAAQQEEGQRLWQYAIVAAIAALAVEGVLAARTA